MGTKAQQTATDDQDLASLIKDFTIDQLRYVAVRPYVSFDKEAAERIGRSRMTVSKWKNKADIDRAVSLIAADGVIVTSEILRRHLPQAAQVIIKQLESRNPMMQHRAAVDILDRAMGKAITRSEISGPGGEPIETKDADSPEHNRAISTLAHAIGALIPGEGGEPDGPLDATEQETVVGPAE